MKTIVVKPIDQGAKNAQLQEKKKVEPWRHTKNSLKNTILKRGQHRKGNTELKKVDPFEAAVIDELYKNTELFPTVEANLNLDSKHGDVPQEENKEDIRCLWHQFMEDTSMHGLKHVNQQQQYKLRRVIWLCAVVAMGSFMAYSLYNLFYAYSQYPTLSSINFDIVEELPFPAVTICNVSPFKRSALNGDPILNHYLLSTSRLSPYIPTMNYADPVNAELNIPLNETWLQSVSPTVNEMFIHCIESNVDSPCENKLTPYITEAGLCYTFNSQTDNDTMTTSLTGSNSAPTFYIFINQSEYVYNQDLAAGVKIVLHDPQEEPDVVNKAIVASPGFATYVSLKMTKYKYLPAPYKATGNQYCLETKAATFVNPLKYYTTYSRDGCMRECKRDYVVNQCRCRWFTDYGNETICSLADYDVCYKTLSDAFDGNATEQRRCSCRLECEFTKYDASVSTTYFPANVYTPILNSLGFQNHRTDWLELRVFFDTLSFLNIQQVAEYSPEMIVGVIGGQMGICLGASLLTLSELVEFIILSVCVVFKRMTKKK